MSVSSASRATTEFHIILESTGPARIATGPFFAAASVADQRILQSQFFLLELMKQVVVGVRAMHFGIDFRGKRGMFGCDGLFLGMVHWSISFRWLTQDGTINHDSRRLSRAICIALAGGGAGSPLAVITRDGGTRAA